VLPIVAATLVLAAYIALFISFQLANPDLPVFPWDTTAWWLPGIQFIRDSLWRGELPLWNPHQMAGSPFLATFSGGLYPLLLVFMPLPPHIAIVAHTAFHLLLGGVFTVFFARRIGLRTAGALTAGLAFIGSFQLTGSANVMGGYLSTFIWLPAVLLVVHRVVSSPGLGNGLLFSATIATLFLAGHIQGALYITQLGGLYALYLMLWQPWPNRGRAVACLMGFGVLSLGIVCIQLLTTLDLAATATRNIDGLSLKQAAMQSVASSRIWPGLTGRGEGWVSLPALFLPLALVGLSRREHRSQALFFLIALCLTLDFMRGTDGVVFPIYYQLPMGNIFRIPIRIGFVMEFAAAMLMGIGVSAVASWPTSRRQAIAMLALLLPLLVAVDGYLRHPTRFRYDPLTVPDSLYGPKRLVEFARARPLERMFLIGDHVPIKFGQLHSYFTLPDYEAILPGRYARFFDLPEDLIWHGQVAVTPSKPSLRWMDQFTTQNPRLLDLMSVRYYIDGRFPRHLLDSNHKREPGKIPRIVAEREENRLARAVEGRHVLGGFPGAYERASALPRSYIVHELRRAESEDQALVWVRALDFDPRQVAIVNADVGPIEAAPEAASERAVIVKYESQRVSIEADCASSCLLVLTDLYDENWRVTVDGGEASMRQVDYLFRGVELSPGSHEVEFSYDPSSFRQGRLISSGALMAFLVLCGWHWQRMRTTR